MTLYKDATCESYHPDAGLEEEACEVRIEGDDIVVSTKAWMYRGKEDGPGHFRLGGREQVDGDELEGRATLHRFEGESVLVGDWKVGKYFGAWRIRLG